MRNPWAWVWSVAFAACSGGVPGLGPGADGAVKGPDGALPDASDDQSLAPDRAPPPQGEPVALWRLPRELRQDFSLPWPNDLLREASGRVDLEVLPNENDNTIVRQYVRQFDGRLEGFSTVGAVYLRFGRDLDPATLPSPERSRSPEASVQLVDVDPASRDRGQRVPIQWHFRVSPTAYWPARTLAVAPVFGFPLRPSTRYALVVTREARATGGVSLRRDEDLERVLGADGSDPLLDRARTLYAPALAELARAGVAREAILSLAVFTTQDPTRDFFLAADWLRRSGPTPELLDVAEGLGSDNYRYFRGHYGPNPVFQDGAPPYTEAGSGGFVPGPDGVPTVRGMQNIRFALTIPRRTSPPRGYPLAVYAHGTGGNAESFITDGTADALASQGVAALGFDQIFHGERMAPGATPDVAFFNFTNPSAGRTNNQQAGLDLVQCGRLVPRLEVPVRGEGGTMSVARFDATRLSFFGHSQGGLNGPLWLAADDSPRAAVLSGAGAALVLSIVLKTRPVDIPRLVSSALGTSSDEFNTFHPVLTLAQLIADPSDPINYARRIVTEPREGVRPHHVFQTQGFIDRFAPPPTIAALALAIGLPLVTPTPHPEPAYALLGLPPATLPVRANLAQSAFSGAWMQFDAPSGRDGHFVVFDVPAARLRAARVLGSAATDPEGVPTVPAMVP
ncbi:MAG: hypothetical protein HY903_21760 [Deltaproteobacteria bacterium]|nr:hypothetical protein [Deltaproteobacteria bacterium]